MIKGITFAGVRTASMEPMRAFLTAVGYTLIHESQDFYAFRAPDGSRFELFGPGDENHKHFSTGPAVGFEVDDIEEARRMLESLKVEFLSDVRGRVGGTQWIHFRGPDGNVYEVVHHSKP